MLFNDNQERVHSEFRYFREKEFACKCCGVAKMYHHFIQKLEIARGIAQTPFIINSGYRCHNHNSMIGASRTSSHPLGVAVDISCTSDNLRWIIIEALKKSGIKRIGIRKDFIHADDDLHKTPKVMWVY
jgi:uncharacterized protein YcbK (DUF882 family)